MASSTDVVVIAGFLAYILAKSNPKYARLFAAVASLTMQVETMPPGVPPGYEGVIGAAKELRDAAKAIKG